MKTVSINKNYAFGPKVSKIGNREKSEIEDRKSSQYFFNMATLFRNIGAPLLNAIDPFASSLQ